MNKQAEHVNIAFSTINDKQRFNTGH